MRLRSSALAPSPKSRSKTTRGFISMGSGSVGEPQEIVLTYAQAYPASQSPTNSAESSASSREDSGVS